MVELKPCPFCGGTNISAFEGSTHRWGFLACSDCGGNRGDCRKADISLAAEHETNVAAFAVDWNARTGSTQVSPQPERVLPHPGSQEASAILDALLAEYNYPANAKNAARAGWEGANRWFLQSAAPSVSGPLTVQAERWLVARETTVQGVTMRAKLGYTVLADAQPFDTFEAASAWIKRHDLPVGWVAMQVSHNPWPALFGMNDTFHKSVDKS